MAHCTVLILLSHPAHVCACVDPHHCRAGWDVVAISDKVSLHARHPQYLWCLQKQMVTIDTAVGLGAPASKAIGFRLCMPRQSLATHVMMCCAVLCASCRPTTSQAVVASARRSAASPWPLLTDMDSGWTARTCATTIIHLLWS